MKYLLLLAVFSLVVPTLACGGGGSTTATKTETATGMTFMSGIMGAGASQSLTYATGGTKLVDLIVRVRVSYMSPWNNLGIILQPPGMPVQQSALLLNVLNACASTELTLVFSATPDGAALAAGCPPPGVEHPAVVAGGFVSLDSLLGSDPNGMWTLTAFSGNATAASVLEWSITFVTE